ncbi:hypothetical protein H0O02_01020 [Candidatus Micrarchaeota archaeon]|nr:hypothetical protein [Candidatus Micrarchaeota archaeon]
MVANGFFRNAIFRDPKKATMRDELKARGIDLLEPRVILYGIDKRFVFIEFEGKLDRIKGNNMLGQMPLIKLNRKLSKEAAELVETTLDVCRKLEGSECMGELEKRNIDKHKTKLIKEADRKLLGFAVLIASYALIALPVLTHAAGINVYTVAGGIAGGIALFSAAFNYINKTNRRIYDLINKKHGVNPAEPPARGIDPWAGLPLN